MKTRLNAETQRTQRGAEKTFLIHSAKLCVLCVSAFIPVSNPNGIVSFSPGLRETSYPGSPSKIFSTPTGLCHAIQRWLQPRWGCGFNARFPRVAPASQPWAEGRNPFGIQLRRSRNNAETQRTRRRAEKTILTCSAKLCVLCVSAFIPSQLFV